MTRGLLQAKVCALVKSSHPDNVRKKVESILYVHGAYFCDRGILEESLVQFFLSPGLGITNISFPLGKPLTKHASLAHFEYGLWKETEGLVRWILMTPDTNTEIQTCSFSGERAIAARSVLYTLVSRLPESDHPCRSGWGSTPDLQCVGCGRVYAVGLGWSEQGFDLLKSTPKIACRYCHPLTSST